MTHDPPKLSKTRQRRKDKVVALVSEHVPAGGKVLEVSCGAGTELARLQAQGYEVKGTNYTQYEYEQEGVPIDHGVDLLSGLPYDDHTFDAVLLIDVIEHVANHDRALYELSRVCKEGGVVIVMTPNAMKISSRIHFLFSGFLKTKREFIGFDVPHESAYAFHNYPPHLPVLLYQMQSHGLALADFTGAIYKAKSFPLYILLGPFIGLATWFNLQVSERNLKGTQAGRDLFKALTSFPGLCAEFYFAVGRKTADRTAQTSQMPSWAKNPGEVESPAPTEGRDAARV